MHYHNAPDAHLVQAVRDGDVAAFGELFSRYRSDVERICRGRLRDPHLVEDAVQATFVRALERVATFEGDEKIGHFIFATAKYQCMDRSAARRRHVERLSPMEAEVRAVVNPSDWCDDESLDQINVDELLGALPDDQASMLVEHHVHGHSLAELAQKRGATPKSMSVRIYRARRKAADYANSRGIWGLVPIPLFPRLVAWLRRHGLAAHPVSSAAMVAAAVAAVVVVPSAPPGGMSVASSTPIVHADVAPSVWEVPTRPSTDATALPRLGLATSYVESAAQRGGGSRTPGRQTVVPVSEVIVPGTEAGWMQEHPVDPDHIISTQVAGEHVITVTVDGVEETDPVLRSACDAGTTAAADAVSCRGNG